MVHKPNNIIVLSALAVVFSGRPWITPVENVRILAVETIAGKSHWNFMSGVLRSLTDAGHHVTVFTQFPEGSRNNYTEIDTSGDFDIALERDLETILENWKRPEDFLSSQPRYSRWNCNKIYGNARLGDIMKTGRKSNFDVIIVEPFTFDCMSHLASTLNLPIIYVIPYPMMMHVERAYTGHLSNPACVSHLLAPQSVPKTFVQRFYSTALLVYSILISKYHYLKLEYNDPQPYDLSPTVNPSIIFQNTHYISEVPRPTSPNVIEIGGIHIKPPKNIPKNIVDYIESAPHGVIIFTFGSIVKFSSLPEHIQNAFKEALAQVPQNVLWKYDGEMKDKPKNVMIQKWFPQREILLHPNVKLFISHGGISGVYEAVDAGVPVLGFPLFFDQPRNIEHLVNNDMAISMDLFAVTKDTLLNSILELVKNEKYMQNAKINSQRFKDRPLTPEQSVVYWTEYVVHHKGASHLQLYSLNLTWYQYLLLDVIAVLFICIFTVLFVVFKIYKYTCKYSSNVKVKSQ